MTRMLLAAFLGGLLALPDGAAPAESVKVGEPVVVASGALVAQPHGAFGDGVYLAVWQDGWGGVGATAGVKALRLQARTLAPLDREPMVLAGGDPQEAPATAHGGGIFLVVWQEFRAGKHYVIRAARVDARTGRPLGDAYFCISRRSPRLGEVGRGESMAKTGKRRIKHAKIVEVFAERLRATRAAREMTQRDLAERAKVTLSYVSKLEAGGAAPGIHLLERLAGALNIPIAELLPLPLEEPRSDQEQLESLFESLLAKAGKETLLLLKLFLARLAESAAVSR